MAWEWKKAGIMLPPEQWAEFEVLVERLYGKKNKGRKKYLYGVAFRALFRMGDDEIKFEAHRLEAEEHGVLAAAPRARVAATRAQKLARRAEQKRAKEQQERRSV